MHCSDNNRRRLRGKCGVLQVSDLDLCVALQVLRDAGKPDLAITVREEIDRLRAANARLAAECGRKQEWIDAVMAQGCVYTSQRGIDWMSGNAFRTTEVGAQTSTRTIALIIRPQPLAKE